MKIKVRKDGKFEIPGVMFTQNGKRMASIVMEHEDLDKVSFVETFEADNLKGNQRTLIPRHMMKFSKDIVERGATHPQSLVGTLCNGAKWENSNEGSEFGKVIFPRGVGKFISIQDGQHSTGSVSRAVIDKKDLKWQWSVSVNLEGDWKERIKIHSDINSHQQKSDRSALMHRNILIGNVDSLIQRCGSMFLKLNGDANSVLNNRVKLFDSQKKRISLNDLISRCLPAFRYDLVREMDDDLLYATIVLYFNEWREQFPTIWDDSGNFVLSGGLGIKVLARFFPDVCQHLILTKGRVDHADVSAIIHRSFARKMNWSKSVLVETHGYQVENYLHKKLKEKTSVLMSKKEDAEAEEETTEELE